MTRCERKQFFQNLLFQITLPSEPSISQSTKKAEMMLVFQQVNWKKNVIFSKQLFWNPSLIFDQNFLFNFDTTKKNDLVSDAVKTLRFKISNVLGKLIKTLTPHNFFNSKRSISCLSIFRWMISAVISIKDCRLSDHKTTKKRHCLLWSKIP